MQSQNPELILFLFISTAILLGFTAFILFLVFAFDKKQSILKKNIEILKLNEQQNILNAQLEIQENTFRTISEDIHDNISLSLTLAKLHLNTCNPENSGNVILALESSVDLISKALIDLNDISKSLDADLIKKQGLIQALEYEKEILQRNGRYRVDLKIEGDSFFLESSKELLVFRMIQEACNNIIKHANATCIGIRLDYLPNLMQIVVSDNGRGFDLSIVEEETFGLRKAGLKNIRNRASAMQGKSFV